MPTFARPMRPEPALLALLLLLAAVAPGCSKSTKPVVLPPIRSVTVTPDTDTLQVGQIKAFTTVVVDTNNVAVSVPIDWTTSNTAIATVDIAGQVRAQSEGTALIVAEVGGKSDTATVAVFPDTGWIAQTSNAIENLEGVFFQPDGRTGWAVGAGGLLLSTADAGGHWSRQLLSSFQLNAVWFWDADHGCIVGNGGTVLISGRAFDGSLAWFRPDTVFSSENLYDVTFANSDSLIGWAVGQGGVVLRTANGGRTWTKQFIPGAQALRSVSFAGSLDGWAAGDAGVIVGTHDRGLTWFVVQPSVTTQALKSVWRASTLRAIAVGAVGVAPRTWVPPADTLQWRLENAGASYALNGVSFGDSVAFAVGSTGGAAAVLRSDDFGVTWAPQFPRALNPLNDVFFIDHQHGWAVGNGGTIRHTARGGTR